MRKLLSLLFCSFMLLGCSKINDRIDKLTDRVDNLENTTLPTIAEQIASIQETLPQLQQADSEIKDYISTLQDKVSTLEQSVSDLDEKVAALEQETQPDISDVLAQLNSYKQEVQGKIDTINGLIESLQAADKSLEQKIASLEGDLDAQRDWVETTFATLEQYNGLVDDIALIRTDIETINQDLADMETRLNEKIKTDIASAVAGLESDIQAKVTEITDAYTAAISTAREEITAAYTSAISSAIEDCVTSMKSWVHEELANYYDIASVDAKVKQLQDAIAAGDAATDEKLTSEIEAVNESIETAKSELTEAYQQAIASAIETNNGVIDAKIAQQIESVNKRIDEEVQTLTARVDDIERRLSELEEKVDGMTEQITALLKRIQSVTYVPRYDDGKIEVRRIEGQNNGIAEMDFLISPKDVVTDLEKVWTEAVSVKAVHTLTRSSVEFIDMPVLGFTADAANGVITVKASGENLGAEFFAGSQSASAALFISDGNNNVTSEYVPMLLNNDNPIRTDNVIYYTTSDGKTITPSVSNIVENKYENGQGVITFSDAITTIGDWAFSSCSNLTSITLPDGVTTIGDSVFYGCSSLTSITLPEGLTTIGDDAFSSCSNLISITIPDGVTTIGSSAFSTCVGLTSFAGKYASSDQRCLVMDDKLVAFAPSGLTEYTIPDGVTTIGMGAFWNCASLTSITLPESLTAIEDRAFYYCRSLARVYCQLTTPPTMGSEVFLDSPVESIYVPRASVDAYKSASGWSDYASQIVGYDLSSNYSIYYTTSDGEMIYPRMSNIVDNKYENGQGVITFSDTVTTIGDHAFDSCSSLTSITLPDGVTTIGDYAFCGCSSLTSITLPESLMTVGDYAFDSCSSLISFYGKYASSDQRCLVIDGTLVKFAPSGLTEYTIPEGVTTIGDSAFRDCHSLTSIMLPEGVTTIGDRAFRDCSSLPSITLPESVTTIGEEAFNGCLNLTHIAIPEGVTVIETGTFSMCCSLTSIKLPTSLTTIGSHVFNTCENLTSITIPEGVTTIRDSAFAYSMGLTNIVIPEGVTTIENNTFEGCFHLTSITLPKSLTTIGWGFSSCYSLTDVYCQSTTPPTMDLGVFSNSRLTIYVPRASIHAYKSADGWRDYASQIVGYDF